MPIDDARPGGTHRPMINPTYARTISRHRLVLSLPIVLTTAIALWFVAGKPNSYMSTASLWVDNPAPAVSSLDNSNPAILPPAANAQQLLNELLTTRHFRVAVGQGGPLAGYLKTHSSQGWGPSALLAGQGSLRDRLEAALDTKHVSTAVAGPQVLAVSLRGPTPNVAAGTLEALVAEFNKERRALDVAGQKAKVSYWQKQADAASTAVANAKKELYAYNSGGSSDKSLQALNQAVTVASARLTHSRTAFHQASVSYGASRGEGPLVRVVDPPKVPEAPVSGRKTALFALIAGLFVGGLLSLLGVVALSAHDRDLRLTRVSDAVRRLQRSLSGDASQPDLEQVDERASELSGDGRHEGAVVASNGSGSHAHQHRGGRARSKVKGARPRRR